MTRVTTLPTLQLGMATGNWELGPGSGNGNGHGHEIGEEANVNEPTENTKVAR